MARAGRSTELRRDLRLAGGYLSVALGTLDDGDDDDSCFENDVGGTEIEQVKVKGRTKLRRKKRRDLGKFLAEKVLEEPFRLALAGGCIPFRSYCFLFRNQSF